MNDREIAARFDAVNAATASAQVAADISLELVRGDIFDFHDRLQQNRFPLLKSIFHGKDRCHFECKFAGIDFVERTVNDIDLYIDNRIATEHTVENCFLDSFFDGWNVLARNDASDNFVLDEKTFEIGRASCRERV